MTAVSVGVSWAQIPTSSSYIQPQDIPNNIIPFDISAPGEKFPVRWGLDVAWISQGNMQRGISYIGKENLSVARIAFQPTYELTNGNLTNVQKQVLNNRITIAQLIDKNVDITITADQEAMLTENRSYPGVDYYSPNGTPNISRWAELIDATVAYVRDQKKMNIIGLSPFNEPDYAGWKEGDINASYNLFKALKEREGTKDIPLIGANTLNDDNALSWYNKTKEFAALGNTHQLAGSFDNYANFFTAVKNNGHIPVADELHNVGEAMVGAAYGMEIGIWWGWDGLARGQFCRASNNGERLAYAEDRSRWTAASVYRNNADNRIEGFVGTSERQANVCSYLFISKDRDVFVDGCGPLREYLVSTPGSTKYQQGQTNAERYLHFTWGMDVQPAPINGRYILMNKLSKKVLHASNTNDGGNIVQATSKGLAQQQWDVVPVPNTIGGDFSYYTIRSAVNQKPIDILNWSLADNGSVILYGGDLGGNEQFFLEYAGNGCYWIANRNSNLYLQVRAKSRSENAAIVQGSKYVGDAALWKILPVDAACEVEAPAAPQGLKTVSKPASIQITWRENTEDDIDGYIVCRTLATETEWNTIGRYVKGGFFVDNTCEQGKIYNYIVKAIDKSQNISEPSEIVTGFTSNEKTLVANFDFEGDLSDNTENLMTLACHGTPTYSVQRKIGTKSLQFNGTIHYAQVPVSLGSMKEMTFSAWVYWSDNSSWQRILDFGSGTDEYFFLTPNAGSKMRFAIKNGGAEQILEATKKFPAYSWHHVTLTIGKDKVSLYIDGELNVETSDITLRPSDIRPALCYLGRSQFVTDKLFKGYLDDVRFYNYALSADEVAAVAGATANGIRSAQDAQGQPAPDVYTIGGVKLSQPQRGLNIIGGKKVIK